jgi:hypothetical protein
MKIEKMAQESRVQKAMEEQESRFGRITRSISGAQGRVEGNASSTCMHCCWRQAFGLWLVLPHIRRMFNSAAFGVVVVLTSSLLEF